MMELTVVITCYNNEKCIEQCLRSVLKQTFTPKEIIVVDDCSTDSTVDVVRQLAQECSSIRLIQNEYNSGPSVGRNRGIMEACTEYVTTLDGDDYYYDENKLYMEMNLIEKYRSEEKDIIAYSYIYTVAQDGSMRYRKFMEPEYYTEGRLTSRLIAWYRPSTFPRDYCVRRQLIIDAGMYREDMRLYEDLELLIRLSTSHEFFCTRHYGTCYRVSDKGLSSAKLTVHRKVLKELWSEHINDVAGIEKFRTILLHVYVSVREYVSMNVRRIKSVMREKKV